MCFIVARIVYVGVILLWQQLMGQHIVSVRICFLDTFMCSRNHYAWTKWLKVHVCEVCVHLLSISCNKMTLHIVSREVNKRHLQRLTLVCQNNLCWQTWCDILSVLGCSANESSIITSLMGLEWGQSFMTLCFIASPEISVPKWEGCRYFQWSYFLTRGCLWLMAFSLQSHLGNPKE